MNPINKEAPDGPQPIVTNAKAEAKAKVEYKTTHGYTVNGVTFTAGDKQMLTTEAAAKLVGFVKKV